MWFTCWACGLFQRCSEDYMEFVAYGFWFDDTGDYTYTIWCKECGRVDAINSGSFLIHQEDMGIV